MERLTLQVGSYEVNCSIITNGDQTLVIDPGADSDVIVRHLDERRVKPAAIALTHAHFDHIGAIPDLQRRWPDLPVYVHPDDVAAFGHPMNQSSDYPPVARPSGIRDIRTLANVAVIETPGHTPGGVCLYWATDGLLISGDTLFAGSVGRTDFPGGDMNALLSSLAKLTALPGDTLVVPGHGPFTTIGAERLGNPFLR